MKSLYPAIAIAGLWTVALISLGLATTGEYVPTSVAVYVMLWVVPLAAFALIIMLRRVNPGVATWQDRMDDSRTPSRWTIGGGALIFLVIAGPLWNEFRDPRSLVWNILLAAFLLGLAAAALLLHLYFKRHPLELGEARFDTANKPEDC